MGTEHSGMQAPEVDEASDGVLDPATLPAPGATIRIKPYDGMAYRDHVYLFVGDHYTDDIPISSSAVGRDVTFPVEAKEFVAGADNLLPIRYEVQFYQGDRKESLVFTLQLQAGFEVDATLDLSDFDYVVSVEKPPKQVPSAARMRREAQWGSAPYTYASSDSTIAKIDEASGEVIAMRNGHCSISATDSQNVPRSYSLTIKGIREVHFLSHNADWKGMAEVCATAKLQPPTIAQMKRFWTLYYPDAAPVATYLGWLNYPFWTGDVLGAGTAWTYDLNGDSINDNASSHNTDSFWQVVGVSQV
ncbi:hypothetical protein ABIA54_000851 [Pseudomonas sp. EB276 TE3739]|uniref:hypothetical protein n=1 Tax=Pseudomonas TaxID=286 RepID=UPI00209D5EA8|nr:hypothetical protein [Pseudomonas koreensis]MCP1475057.1 hypothetical protein [Pseudomonas koreensis]